MNRDMAIPFSIRAAKPGDEGAIVALLRELAVYEKLESRFCLDEAAVTRDMLGPDAAARCDLLELQGEIAGVAVWYWMYASFSVRRVLYIEDLYVTPRFRGQGLGRALLVHMARAARSAGGFMSWLVLDWNMPAIDFYLSLGAQADGEWTRFSVEGDALERLCT